jgi:hypothetical protein
LALRPNPPGDPADKPDASADVLMREVDDAVRQQDLLDIGKRHGTKIALAVIAGLVALAGYLYWGYYQRQQSGDLAERYALAMDKLSGGAAEDARQDLIKLASSSDGAAKASALMTQAAILLGQGKVPDAIKAFAVVANDSSLPQPYRDLALVREIATGFDTLPPQQVVDRLKPLAVPGNPWFGSAGELTGMALLKLNKPDLAGAMFAAVAKDDKAPQTIRRRVRQLAAQLGVDAVDEEIKAASEAAAAEAEASPSAGAPAANPAAAAAAPAAKQ